MRSTAFAVRASTPEGRDAPRGQDARPDVSGPPRRPPRSQGGARAPRGRRRRVVLGTGGRQGPFSGTTGPTAATIAPAAPARRGLRHRTSRTARQSRSRSASSRATSRSRSKPASPGAHRPLTAPLNRPQRRAPSSAAVAGTSAPRPEPPASASTTAAPSRPRPPRPGRDADASRRRASVRSQWRPFGDPERSAGEGAPSLARRRRRKTSVLSARVSGYCCRDERPARPGDDGPPIPVVRSRRGGMGTVHRATHAHRAAEGRRRRRCTARRREAEHRSAFCARRARRWPSGTEHRQGPRGVRARRRADARDGAA